MTLKMLGKKLGMTQIFDEKGNITVCTVISVDSNVVIQIKTEDKDNYSALQMGAVAYAPSKKKNVKKPLQGHFKKANAEPMRYLFECRLDDVAGYEVGQEIKVDNFEGCPLVDVIGQSIGKGFQGVMKRHGFKGGPAAHGSGFHRHAGSTGMRSTPGRCLPGVKKAGQMGAEQKTIENLPVVRIDLEKNLMLVKGSVPGPRNGYVYVRKSVKKG